MSNEKTERKKLYSIRMHASSDKGHLCGAERIVSRELLHVISAGMVDRAMIREDEGLVSVSISVDAVELGSIHEVSLLPIRTANTESPERAEEEALRLLTTAGVSRYAARRALKAIASGPSPQGRNMGGSMILHAERGDRLEPDQERGVRVSRMDLTGEAREDLWKLLDRRNMRHPRVLEAVVLASKVAAVPGIIAEVCRSDDPDYTTGYVASPGFGYVRIPNMKKRGDALGGRALFVKNKEILDTLIDELERVPYLISKVPSDERG
jgi:6-carboxyhexanoate--CoA ligase